MLKYSPEHMHCLANIYGALAPPNTGVLAVQSTAANQKVSPILLPYSIAGSFCVLPASRKLPANNFCSHVVFTPN